MRRTPKPKKASNTTATEGDENDPLKDFNIDDLKNFDPSKMDFDPSKMNIDGEKFEEMKVQMEELKKKLEEM